MFDLATIQRQGGIWRNWSLRLSWGADLVLWTLPFLESRNQEHLPEASYANAITVGLLTGSPEFWGNPVQSIAGRVHPVGQEARIELGSWLAGHGGPLVL